MNREMKMLAVATAAALLAGCASGDTFGNDVIGDNPIEMLLCAPLFICGAKKTASASNSPAPQNGSASAAPTPVTPKPAALTSWSALPAQTYGEASGPAAEAQYWSSEVFAYLDAGGRWVTGKAFLEFDAQHDLVHIQGNAGSFTDLSRIGFGSIEVGPGGSLGVGYKATPPFVGGSDRTTNLVANPYFAGWDYQSFGVWNYVINNGPDWGVESVSFGVATLGSAVPSSGAATFTGKLGGLYFSPTSEGSVAAANLTVNVDFGARSLSFASSGTRLTRDLASGTAAPGLDLSGTLTYLPSTSAFTGTLTSAGGTLAGATHGQFYGPAAQELGGAFAVKSSTTVETFTGAYGAKR